VDFVNDMMQWLHTSLNQIRQNTYTHERRASADCTEARQRTMWSSDEWNQTTGELPMVIIHLKMPICYFDHEWNCPFLFRPPYRDQFVSFDYSCFSAQVPCCDVKVGQDRTGKFYYRWRWRLEVVIKERKSNDPGTDWSPSCMRQALHDYGIRANLQTLMTNPSLLVELWQHCDVWRMPWSTRSCWSWWHKQVLPSKLLAPNLEENVKIVSRFTTCQNIIKSEIGTDSQVQCWWRTSYW